MRKKRVLILSEGFGSGHTQAAQGLSMGLRQLSSNIMTRVLELGAFQHPTIAPWIFSVYRKTVTNKPHLVGRLYQSYNSKSLSRLSSLALHRIFYARTANIIHQLRPDLIISTHPFPTVIVSRLKRAGLSTPLCTVITDYDAHGSWVDSAVNNYLVSTTEVKNKLILRGISSEAIQITGIPVHPKFWRITDREETRISLKLQDMPTVLIMGGGWGLIDNTEIMTYIAKWREQIQLIFCTGNNEKVLQRLSEDVLYQHPNIHLMGFTKDIDKLMDVSDILITKPGGMTCTEAMAKGIPMLFHSPIPGQEEENCQYFSENGFGEVIQSMGTIEAWFKRLLSEDYILLQQKRFKNHLNIQYNPQDCTESIIKLLQDERTYRVHN
jgi:processive 1,2-diacylglycerol beta-glucosyltransferase